MCSYFFAKNLALGENFLSPTLNIIQPKEFLDSKVEKIRKMSYNSTYKEAQIKVLREFEKSHNISLEEL